MNAEWATTYEAPTSLDADRLIGTYGRRSTLWLVAGLIVIVPLAIGCVALDQAWLVGPIGVWAVFAKIMSRSYSHRTPEYWLTVWLRYRRLPRKLEDDSLVRHHADLRVSDPPVDLTTNTPRGVVEVDCLNLRLTDEETLGSRIKQLHAFYIGLKFPVQVVVRAWQDDETIRRRWFVAVMAPTELVLKTRLEAIVKGLERAGLGGHALNGDLFDTLQQCWSIAPKRDQFGPHTIQREKTYVKVDGEYVRGCVLARIPRGMDANWLAPILDGELAVDLMLWLQPVDNSEAIETITDRINEWETAQQLNVGVAVGQTGRLGYRDPALDDQIDDGKRTLRLLRRPGMLRVYRTTVAFVCRGSTLDEALERERLLIDQLREHVGAEPLLAVDYLQDRAPLFAVPTGEPPVEYNLQIVTPALARMYPFSNSCLAHAGGVKCGISKHSQRENALNVWLLTNPHMAILATTGAGKGYWLKVYLLRLMLMHPDQRVWIIQVEKDEYGSLADTLPPTTFTPTNPALRRTVANPEWPIWDSLDDSPRGRVICIDHLAGIDRQVWSYEPGGVLRGAQCTVYDLTHMAPAERGPAVAYLLAAIEASAKHDQLETLGYVVVDELGIVLRSREAAEAIEIGYRRFRSIPHLDDPKKVSRRAMIGLSQRPSDLLAKADGPGKVIADLAECHLYLRQKSTELKVTKSALNLTDDEVDYLELAENGDGLLVAGRARVALRLQTTDQEHNMAKT